MSCTDFIHLPACHQTAAALAQQPVRMKMHNQSPATTETRKCRDFVAEDGIPWIRTAIGLYSILYFSATLRQWIGQSFDKSQRLSRQSIQKPKFSESCSFVAYIK